MDQSSWYVAARMKIIRIRQSFISVSMYGDKPRKGVSI